MNWCRLFHWMLWWTKSISYGDGPTKYINVKCKCGKQYFRTVSSIYGDTGYGEY